MIFPFKIIESKISSRKEFELTDGYQPTYALFYLKSGCFVMEINGVKEKICTGDCVILPDYIHFRRTVVNPIEFIYLKFSNEPNARYSLDIPYGKIKFKDTARFLSNIENMEKAILNSSLMTSGYREHLLMDILFQIHFEKHSLEDTFEQSGSCDKTVKASVDYINKNISNKILIDDICRAVGTNASTLNYKFRVSFNMSCGQFILNEKMKKARYLLINTTYSISEIARRCGYDNLYYFSNAFKKVHGVSPSEYLKNYRE